MAELGLKSRVSDPQLFYYTMVSKFQRTREKKPFNVSVTLRSFLGRCRIQTGIRRMDISLPSRTRRDSEPWRKNDVNKWKWQKSMVDDKELKVVQEGRIVRRKAGNEGKSKLIKDLTFRL